MERKNKRKMDAKAKQAEKRNSKKPGRSKERKSSKTQDGGGGGSAAMQAHALRRGGGSDVVGGMGGADTFGAALTSRRGGGGDSFVSNNSGGGGGGGSGGPDIGAYNRRVALFKQVRHLLNRFHEHSFRLISYANSRTLTHLVLQSQTHTLAPHSVSCFVFKQGVIMAKYSRKGKAKTLVSTRFACKLTHTHLHYIFVFNQGVIMAKYSRKGKAKAKFVVLTTESRGTSARLYW
jgi:hypothetical protein